MKNKNIIIFATMILSAIGAAQAQTYVYVNDGSGNIYQYDSSTWAGSEIFNYASSSLYGIGQPWSISSGPAANTIYTTLTSGQLATFNVSTLAVSVVGGSGLSGSALGEGRDGYLYMGSGATLTRIDPATGSSVLLGSGAYNYAGDLAVNPLNTSILYGTVLNGPSSDVWLVSVNRSTGAQTLIGDTGVNSANSIWGIGFSADGTLYAGGPYSGAGAIWSLDLTTGAATLQTTLPFAPYDMATQPMFVDEVPEPSSLALTGLSAAGLALLRRRRQ